MLHLQIKTKYNMFHGVTSKANYLSARACVCVKEKPFGEEGDNPEITAIKLRLFLSKT